MNRNIKFLANKSKLNRVTEIDWSMYDVVSGTSGKTYRVAAIGSRFTCECDWHKYHSCGECSHVLAVREFIAQESARRIKLYGDLESARKAHRRIEILNDGLVVSSRSK